MINNGSSEAASGNHEQQQSVGSCSSAVSDNAGATRPSSGRSRTQLVPLGYWMLRHLPTSFFTVFHPMLNPQTCATNHSLITSPIGRGGALLQLLRGLVADSAPVSTGGSDAPNNANSTPHITGVEAASGNREQQQSVNSCLLASDPTNNNNSMSHSEEESTRNRGSSSGGLSDSPNNANSTPHITGVEAASGNREQQQSVGCCLSAVGDNAGATSRPSSGQALAAQLVPLGCYCMLRHLPSSSAGQQVAPCPPTSTTAPSDGRGVSSGMSTQEGEPRRQQHLRPPNAVNGGRTPAPPRTLNDLRVQHAPCPPTSTTAPSDGRGVSSGMSTQEGEPRRQQQLRPRNVVGGRTPAPPPRHDPRLFLRRMRSGYIKPKNLT